MALTVHSAHHDHAVAHCSRSGTGRSPPRDESRTRRNPGCNLDCPHHEHRRKSAHGSCLLSRLLRDRKRSVSGPILFSGGIVDLQPAGQSGRLVQTDRALGRRGLNAPQTVTARFGPPPTAPPPANVTTPADGDPAPRPPPGTGPDVPVPAVTITTPTTNPTFSTSSPTLTLGGTASDTVGVTQVTWANDRGGSGTAAGTTSWTASGIALQVGVNVLTVTARDAAANIATASLMVTLTPTFTLTVSKTGAGSGTVTSSPVGISCGATCAAAFASGSAVTLTAAPAAGSMFTGWSGGGRPRARARTGAPRPAPTRTP